MTSEKKICGRAEMEPPFFFLWQAELLKMLDEVLQRLVSLEKTQAPERQGGPLAA